MKGWIKVKKLKTLLALLLVFVLAFSLAGCGKKDDAPEENVKPSENVQPSDSEVPEKEPEQDNAEDKEPQRVLFSCMSLSDSTFIFLDNLLRENFEGGGYVYDSISAEMDPVLQIEQIENAAVQGYDLVVVIPVNGEAVSDACQRAMDQGTLIFSFIFDTIARNSYRTTDETIIARTAVELAMEWAERTFPNAADGSINCVVMGQDNDEVSKRQHDTAYEVALEYPQLNVIENVACEATLTASALSKEKF